MTPVNPASLGEFLRHEREKRGFTVEQVASATKISLRLLHSLENDLYQELPAKPFIRGFVIAYCRFLGVNPQEVLTRFSIFIEEKSEERTRRTLDTVAMRLNARMASRVAPAFGS